MAAKMSTPAIILTSSSMSISDPPEFKKKPLFPADLGGAAAAAAEETFVLKLGLPTLNVDNNVFLQKNAPVVDDPEIDVFDAQKYFNDGFKINRSPKKIDPNELPNDRPCKNDGPPAPPMKIPTLRSIRSESSTNSRSALLFSNPRNFPTRKSVGKGFLSSIVCNCSCTDRNSVDVDDFSDGAAAAAAVRKTVKMEEGRVGKKLSVMSSWREISEGFKIPSSEIKDGGGGEDSDGSSDLFEIESVCGGGGGGRSLLSRQASDGLSGCYAPSEASIEWSVVTASAADFSVVSESEELRFGGAGDRVMIRKDRDQNSKMSSFPKLRPAILSGCKSQKAVSVAGDAHRANSMLHKKTKAPAPAVSPATGYRDINENKLGVLCAKIRPQSLDMTTAGRVLPPQNSSYNYLIN
ncbi:protein PHYTOCHROME KINASE SUBSTRATE 1-like [Andrographis paniculata]|uniref:protein PHYTOCHROME KINASE SUBSTRATE 1-like n=1 Tax=Andrographis paniculata TaxID=175694 RepID=UPI0021E771BD|nr:protein PHYTOCHROME KINASE SUBSTRATE 1-like [Andrographis paniculata]